MRFRFVIDAAFRHFLPVLLIAITLPACQTLDTRGDDTGAAVVEDRTGEDNWIEELIAGKSPQEAILILEQKAAASGHEEAFLLQSKAALIAIETESPSQVDSRVSALEERFSDSDFQIRLSLLKVRIMLQRQQSSQVLSIIGPLKERATSLELPDVLDLNAEALDQAGFPIDSVRTRIRLDELLGDTTRQEANDRALWRSLMATSPEIISSQISAIPDIFSGWLELANLTHQYKHNGIVLNQELDQWALRHPQHPALRHIIDEVKKRQIATSKHPEHIALLLPLSGKLSGVGKAIRDGFLTASLETRRTLGAHIKIDIYDTEGKAELASLAIQQANQSGAKFIVGPLDKSAVQAAANDPLNTLPLLVLNQIPEDIVSSPSEQVPPLQNKPEIFQFSLAPEGEARQAAERLAQDEHFQIMVIVPQSVWGNRIYEAFATRYMEIGGEILSQQRFQRGTADYSRNIQEGLNLQLSKLRYRQLKASLQKDIEFTPRRRADIDAIFIAASPQEARQLKPQLRFFYADDIPVYATSHVFTGKIHPATDKDLENITFCDMPWVLQQSTAPSSLKYITDTAWPEESSRYSRFHALGIDTFQLIPHLEWLKSNNNDWLDGFTGQLKVESDGNITRNLQWASFRDGIPQPIDDALSRQQSL